MKHHPFAIAAALVLACAHTAAAAKLEIQPGRYEVTGTNTYRVYPPPLRRLIESPKVTTKQLETESICLDQAKAKQLAAYLSAGSPENKPGCTMADLKATSQTVSSDQKCADENEPFSRHVDVTLDGTTIVVTNVSTIGPDRSIRTVTLANTWRRLGDCE